MKRFFYILTHPFRYLAERRRARKNLLPEIMISDNIEKIYDQVRKDSLKNASICDKDGLIGKSTYGKCIKIAWDKYFENMILGASTTVFCLAGFVTILAGLVASTTAVIVGAGLMFPFPSLYLFFLPGLVYLQERKSVSQRLRTVNENGNDSAALIVQHFKGIISKYRDQTIGRGTVFFDVISRCQSMKDQAFRQQTYWISRAKHLSNKDEQAFARRKAQKAHQIYERLNQVLAKLRQRKEALTQHFDEAEKRLPTIEGSITDYFEAKSLEKLEQETGSVEEEAEQVSTRIVGDYLRELGTLLKNANALSVITHKALIYEPKLDLPLLENLAEEINRGEDLAAETRDKIVQLH